MMLPSGGGGLCPTVREREEKGEKRLWKREESRSYVLHGRACQHLMASLTPFDYFNGLS